MITRFVKLPFSFNNHLLQKDLNIVFQDEWLPHYNQNGYSGKWNSISLYAKDGDSQNIFAHHTDDSEILPTALLNKCHYFENVLTHFQCSFLSVRILNLGVGAYIKPHRDHNSGYEDGMFRLHIPIYTNERVAFILDGDHIHMSPGECWYTNVNYVHSVANRGESDRIHLVIDGERNDWSDRLFFSLAPKDSYFPKQEENYSQETILLMIKQLELNELPASEELIVSLRKKLNVYNSKM